MMKRLAFLLPVALAACVNGTVPQTSFPPLGTTSPYWMDESSDNPVHGTAAAAQPATVPATVPSSTAVQVPAVKSGADALSAYRAAENQARGTAGGTRRLSAKEMTFKQRRQLESMAQGAVTKSRWRLEEKPVIIEGVPMMRRFVTNRGETFAIYRHKRFVLAHHKLKLQKAVLAATPAHTRCRVMNDTWTWQVSGQHNQYVIRLDCL